MRNQENGAMREWKRDEEKKKKEKGQHFSAGLHDPQKQKCATYDFCIHFRLTSYTESRARLSQSFLPFILSFLYSIVSYSAVTGVYECFLGSVQ